MCLLNVTTETSGQVDITPRIVKIRTTDSYSTITAANYLNQTNNSTYSIRSTDILFVTYGPDSSTSFGMFTPTISNGSVTLVPWVDPSNVLLPIVSGNVPIFNGTTGQIKDSGLAPSSTVSQLYAVTSPGSLTSGNVAKFNDANGTVADAGFAASNVMLLNATNTMSGTGRIVAVKANGTEATNLVTASGMAGVITTSSLSTAGGASYAITWTNTYITSTSVILLTIMGGTNTTQNITLKATAGSGTSTLTIYNNTAATALNGTILIGYLVM